MGQKCVSAPRLATAAQQVLVRVNKTWHDQAFVSFDDFNAEPALFQCPDIDVADSHDLVRGDQQI